MDQLSRRLHQSGRGIARFPGFLFSGAHVASQSQGMVGYMAASRSVRSLSPELAAYLAGLVDGEGTVTLSCLHRGEHRRLVVSISNTDLALLEFVQATIGVGQITAKRTYSQRHSPSYAYKVSGRQALALLSQIARYLRTYRSTRADMAIHRYVALTPRNGKYRGETLRQRHEFEQDFLAIGPGPRGRRKDPNP